MHDAHRTRDQCRLLRGLSTVNDEDAHVVPQSRGEVVHALATPFLGRECAQCGEHLVNQLEQSRQIFLFGSAGRQGHGRSEARLGGKAFPQPRYG